MFEIAGGILLAALAMEILHGIANMPEKPSEPKPVKERKFVGYSCTGREIWR